TPPPPPPAAANPPAPPPTRPGNRQRTCALPRIAINQGRWHPPARAYLARKQAEGKSRREALRCLKRHLARTVHRQLTSPANPKTPNPTTPTTPPHLTQEQRAARKRTAASSKERAGSARARFPRSAVPDLTESASFRSEDQAAVGAVPLHADSLVDPDRRRVLRTHEQAHRRDALQKQTAEVAHAAFGIALVPLRRVDPDLLHLHGRRRPRR